MTMRVGIVGTGKMGSAMARNLLDRGYAVAVWNIDLAMMEPVVAAGAMPYEPVESLVENVDSVIVMLWDDAVAREISLGRVISAARKGQLVIETTTLSPQMYESLAQAAAARGVDFLASPVIGSVDGARAGTLRLYPGGTRRAFDRAQELLSAMGTSVTFTGSPAASGHLKLASNCVLAVLADTIGELLGTLGKAGVDRALSVETLFYMLERVGTKRQQVLDRDSQPRFSAGALLKDLRSAHDAWEQLHVEAPLMESASTEFGSVVAAQPDLRSADYIAVGLALERAASDQRRDECD
jgi:3-hydroxyisobutyrate dehydrogenase-like beta-hydroxyacid dehydrogenase